MSESLTEKSANQLLVDYLIHSCLYYEMSECVISDYEYDMLARELKRRWDEVDHRHKRLVDPEALTVSGFYIKYPTIVRHCAATVLKQAREKPKKDQ